MIIRGTTPVIRFAFNEVNPLEMTGAYLTIRQRNILIERELSDANVMANALEGELTQEETLSLEENVPAKVQCRYKFATGAVGASQIYEEPVYGILKEGGI